MSERRIKAVAGALGPKNVDLTQFRRQAAGAGRALRLKGEDAAGALAFAALDRTDPETGEVARGDPLPGLLLRLKYANQFSKGPFGDALLILLRRHGGMRRRRSATLTAIASVALFEWVHDRCQKCRGARPGSSKPRPCPECGTLKETVAVMNPDTGEFHDEERIMDPARVRTAAVGGKDLSVSSPGANPYCGKCKGLARIFATGPERRGGVRCTSCRGTGVLAFPTKHRWRLVNDYLRSLPRPLAQPLSLDGFRETWATRYYRFLDILRAVDKRLVADIDLGLKPSDNRATDSGLEQEEQAPGDEPDEISGSGDG